MSQLLEQVRDAIRTRHYSIRTGEAYIHWIREYILFCDKRHPAELGAKEISALPSHLTVGRNVAASTQNRRSASALLDEPGLELRGAVAPLRELPELSLL